MIPNLLIGSVAVLRMLGGRSQFQEIYNWMEFIGDRHVALFVVAAFAVSVLMPQKRVSLAQVTTLIGPPFSAAGVLISIASAGGAFGGMLKHSSVGDVIASYATHWDLSLIVVGWAVLVSTASAVGFVQCLVAAKLLPFR